MRPPCHSPHPWHHCGVCPDWSYDSVVRHFGHYWLEQGIVQSVLGYHIAWAAL